MKENTLYYGDNLQVLREHVPSESVDLIYLDPPFNSNQDYNVLFAERDGTRSHAQIKAFEDTWRWDTDAARTYQETVEAGGDVSTVLRAYRTFLHESDMLAYLVMMAPRLVELKRVLKPTGSIYLHCDPTASHYLKLLMDAVFFPVNFLNEITWKRTHSHGNVSRNFGSVVDVLLVYAKTLNYKWNQQYTSFSAEYVERTFKFSDPDGRRWQSVTLRNPGLRPNLHFPFTASNGVTYHPHPNGWGCDNERLKKYDKENRLHFPANPDGALRLKMYLDESPGIKLQNIWDDVPVIGSKAAERLGYPTQKPEALLERIIKTATDGGDIVLDPFCGCGTAIAVAEQLKRRWIGIDITHLAITLIKHRLEGAYQGKAPYKVVGEPVSVPDAKALAESNPQQFELWALGLVGARPSGAAVKWGADRGIDGRLLFHDDPNGDTKQIIISVKAGEHISSPQVRDLRGVIEREGAEIGVFICMETPTRDMRKEAASAGFYKSPWGTHPRIQILTVEELLAGKRIDYPPSQQVNATFKKSKKARATTGETQMSLGEE
jgi:DNA modification methylase